MRGVYLCPCLDDGEDFGGCEVREREVVRGREGYYVAFTSHWICTKEEFREICCTAISMLEMKREWANLSGPLLSYTPPALPSQHCSH